MFSALRRLITLTTVLLSMTSFAQETTSPTVQPDEAHAGSFAILWTDTAESIDWNGLTCAVKVNGKWINATEANPEWETSDEGATDRGRLLKMNNEIFTCTFAMDPIPSSPALRMKATFDAKQDCELGGFKLITSAAKNNGALPLPESKEGLWTIVSDEFSSLRIGNLSRIDSEDPIEQGCWIAGVQNPKAKVTFAFAALTAEQWPTWYEWKRDGKGSVFLTIRAGGENDHEQIQVAKGKTISSDPIQLGLWQGQKPQEVLLQIAGQVGQNIDRKVPMRRPEKGWSTWHYFFRNVSEAEILQNADAVREKLSDDDYKIIQLDGGWWVYPGEFTTDPKKFPEGLAHLSKEIRDRDQKFGLHMSPFRMDAKSDFWKGREDWSIGGEEGKGAKVLDGSNPAVIEWMEKSYGELARDNKIAYFKFDFINQGAKEGKRHDPTMTGLQSYNRAIRAIRQAVPEDIIINGCNALTLAAVDAFDTLRVGPDINHGPKMGPNGEYANMIWGDPVNYIPKEKGFQMTLMNQVRAVARQFYVHNNIAIADCDSILVTPVYSLDEAKCHATLGILTGGTLFLGDRIDTLPEDRLALVTNPRVLSVWEEGQHAIPVDMFDGVECPRIWKLDLKDREVIAVFNWIEEETEDSWSLEDLWLDENATYAVTELWSGDSVKLQDGKLSLKQAPHSVQLLEFKK